MTDRGKIIAIYSTVAVLSALIIGGAMYLGNRMPEQPIPELPMPEFSDIGGEKDPQLFQIARDFTAVNQAGQQVELSDLQGKVWVVAEFFAVCPHCAVRNGQELRSIYDAFKDHPDFQMVCISVDPATDTPARLQEYAAALGADAKNWWFISHPNEKETHEYLEKELKFFAVRERLDPVDRDANGRFAHDMGISVVDREWNVIGKWPLYDAKSEEGRRRDPHLYEKLKQQLHDRLSEELEKNETAGIDDLKEDAPAEDAPPADE